MKLFFQQCKNFNIIIIHLITLNFSEIFNLHLKNQNNLLKIAKVEIFVDHDYNEQNLS